MQADSTEPHLPDTGAGAARPPADHRAGRRRAAGIYGTIVTAAVLAAGGGVLPVPALAVAVLVTLTVYWLAEQYAEVLGEQAEHGHLPTWPRVRAGLANTSAMVSAAYIPVLVLILARVLDASPTLAANLALVAALLLLVGHGWAAARAAELHGKQMLIAVLVAGGLGIVMIALKNFVTTVLH